METDLIPVDALDRAEISAKRLDEWRTHLLKLGSGSLTDIEETSFIGRELRAAACVAGMAELEALLREMLVSVGQQISAARVPIRDLIPSLRPLAAHSAFESLVDTRDSGKVWDHRLALTSLEGSTEIAKFPSRMRNGPQPPLDGRTIQSRHISLVWGVLGLEQPVPGASVVASLKKLTQIRNDVAHRNIGIVDVYSEPGRTARDIAQYLDDLTLLILHIGSKWETYLTNSEYLTINVAGP